MYVFGSSSQHKHTRSRSTIIVTRNNMAAATNRKYLCRRLWYIYSVKIPTPMSMFSGSSMSTEAYSLNIWYASGDFSYPENICIRLEVCLYMQQNLRYNNFLFQRRPCCFRCRCTSASIGFAFVDLADPENIDIGFGILSPYAPEPEI